MEQTKEIAAQSLLYVGAFYVTWLWPTTARIVQLCNTTIPDWLVTLAGCFIPIQGFFNALVYFRPRYNKCSKQHKERSKLWVLRRICFQALCGWIPAEGWYHKSDGRDIEGLGLATQHPGSTSLSGTGEESKQGDLFPDESSKREASEVSL